MIRKIPWIEMALLTGQRSDQPRTELGSSWGLYHQDLERGILQEHREQKLIM
jgi:hypothetical protein